jgi:hypothetical protein
MEQFPNNKTISDSAYAISRAVLSAILGIGGEALWTFCPKYLRIPNYYAEKVIDKTGEA